MKTDDHLLVIYRHQCHHLDARHHLKDRHHENLTKRRWNRVDHRQSPHLVDLHHPEHHLLMTHNSKIRATHDQHI